MLMPPAADTQILPHVFMKIKMPRTHLLQNCVVVHSTLTALIVSFLCKQSL